MDRLKLFCGSANRRLGDEISEYTGIPLGKAELGRFSDGEISIGIKESVRGANVFLIQPMCAPVNENLMELTVGIFPAELSHTSFRSSAYGFSATAGKIGAVCGVLIMTYFVGNNKDLGYYAVAGLISAAFFLSFFLPETGNKRLDEIK